MSEQRLNYKRLAPEGVAALSGLEHYLNSATGLGASLLDLVRLRASQMNGCEFCIKMHGHELKTLSHEPDSRVDGVAEWRDSSAYTQRERAALAWTEAVTSLEGHVPDAAYAAVREHFEEKELVDLTLAIASINAWNRMGVSFLPQWHEPRAAEAPKAEEVSVIKEDGGKVSVDEEKG